MMKLCKKCGYVLKETAGFCSNCGQQQDKEEEEIPESEEHSKYADVNGSKIIRKNLPNYEKKVSPTKWRFIIICFGVIFLLVGCFGYVMDMRESKEVAEYKATNNIYALSNIVTSNANRSKKNKAIEALLEIEQPESLLTLENLLNSDKETEKIIWEKLTEKRIKLPSGIDILKNKNLSQGELIKKYFLSIESADDTLNNIKKLISRLIREDKGYEKISSVLKNGREIVDASGETDKELFEKIRAKNDQWINEENKKENLNSELKTISNDIGVSYANINKNIKEMHSYVIAEYSAQAASRYMYADETTKNMVKATLENMDQLMRQTAEITSGGDPSVKAGIYVDVARNMRPETYREVSRLGLQVLTEIEKISNKNDRMNKIKDELSALNSTSQGKSGLLNLLLNDTRLAIGTDKDIRKPLTVVSKEYNNEISKIKYPQVEIIGNSTSQEKINLYIKDVINRHIETGEKIKKMPKEKRYSGSYVNTFYKIHLNNGKILSLTIDDFVYYSGAHDKRARLGLTFDAETGDLLAWSDLFSEISERKRENINQAILSQANEKKITVFSNPFTGIAKGVLTPKTFCVSERGNPVIIFQPYEIAPYSSGLLEFEVEQDYF